MDVVCIGTFFETIVTFQFAGDHFHLAQLEDVILVGITKPQVGADRVFVLIVLGSTIPVPFQQNRRFQLEAVDTLIDIFALIKELDVHGANFLWHNFSEFLNHSGREVIHARQQVGGGRQGLLEHFGKVCSVYIPIELEALHGLPLILFVGPQLLCKITLVADQRLF